MSDLYGLPMQHAAEVIFRHSMGELAKRPYPERVGDERQWLIDCGDIYRENRRRLTEIMHAGRRAKEFIASEPVVEIQATNMVAKLAEIAKEWGLSGWPKTAEDAWERAEAILAPEYSREVLAPSVLSDL